MLTTCQCLSTSNLFSRYIISKKVLFTTIICIVLKAYFNVCSIVIFALAIMVFDYVTPNLVKVTRSSQENIIAKYLECYMLIAIKLVAYALGALNMTSYDLLSICQVNLDPLFLIEKNLQKQLWNCDVILLILFLIFNIFSNVLHYDDKSHYVYGLYSCFLT